MQPTHNLLEFIKACRDGKSKVLVQYQAVKAAREQFGIQTEAELLAFIGQGALKNRKFLDTVEWRYKIPKEPVAMIDAYEFTTDGKLGYLAFCFVTEKQKWTLKSIHIQSQRRCFTQDEDRRRLNLGMND